MCFSRLDADLARVDGVRVGHVENVPNVAGGDAGGGTNGRVLRRDAAWGGSHCVRSFPRIVSTSSANRWRNINSKFGRVSCKRHHSYEAFQTPT